MSLEARRSLAGQTGESTRETSLSPSTFASRACAASEGGRRGLKRRSSSSSHIARRIGLPLAASPSSASSAARGTGGDDLDLESDIGRHRSEEHTSELQSLMRISYAVFCLKKKSTYIYNIHTV